MKRAARSKSSNTDGLFNIFGSPDVRSEVASTRKKRRKSGQERVEIVSLSAGESLSKTHEKGGKNQENGAKPREQGIKNRQKGSKRHQKRKNESLLRRRTIGTEERLVVSPHDNHVTTSEVDNTVDFNSTTNKSTSKKGNQKKQSSLLGNSNKRLESTNETRNECLTELEDPGKREIKIRRKRILEMERAIPQPPGPQMLELHKSVAEEKSHDYRTLSQQPTAKSKHYRAHKSSSHVEAKNLDKRDNEPQRFVRNTKSKKRPSMSEEPFENPHCVPMRSLSDDRTILDDFPWQELEPLSFTVQNRSERPPDAVERQRRERHLVQEQELLQQSHKRSRIGEANLSIEGAFMPSDVQYYVDNVNNLRKGRTSRDHEVRHYLPCGAQDATQSSGKKLPKNQGLPKAIYLKPLDSKVCETTSAFGYDSNNRMKVTSAHSAREKRSSLHAEDQWKHYSEREAIFAPKHSSGDFVKHSSGDFVKHSSGDFVTPINHLQPRKKTSKGTETKQLIRSAPEKKPRNHWDGGVREFDRNDVKSFEWPLLSSRSLSWDASSFSSCISNRGASSFDAHHSLEHFDTNSFMADPVRNEPVGMPINYLQPRKKGTPKEIDHVGFNGSAPDDYLLFQGDIEDNASDGNESDMNETLISRTNSHSSDSATFCASKDFRAYKLQFQNDGSGKKPFYSSTIRFAEYCMKEAASSIQTRPELISVAKHVSSSIMQSVRERLRQTPLPHTYYKRAQCLSFNQEKDNAQIQQECEELEEALNHVEQQKQKLDEDLSRANEMYASLQNTLDGMPKHNTNLSKILPLETPSAMSGKTGRKFLPAPPGSMMTFLEKIANECN